MTEGERIAEIAEIAVIARHRRERKILPLMNADGTDLR
jgi:hypothetical protein